VALDNVTLKTGEEKLKPLPVRTNHLLIVRLNLADAWRRRSLQVREEEVTPEERGETVEVAEGEAPAPIVAAPPAPSEPETKATPAPSAESPTKAPAKRVRKPKAPADSEPKEEDA